MSQTKWRTTKLPEDYFNRISEYIENTQRNVSVSDFIRDAIDERLQKERSIDSHFLSIKDVIFTEPKIIDIHDKIAENFYAEPGMLKKSFRSTIEESIDLNLFKFLSKFLRNFAKSHPFNDGNKRTALVAVDTFLRLNNYKLILNAAKRETTEDEKFFWQNSNQQKNVKEIEEFLLSHVVPYGSNYDVNLEIQKSMEENKLLLEKLSQ